MRVGPAQQPLTACLYAQAVSSNLPRWRQVMLAQARVACFVPCGLFKPLVRTILYRIACSITVDTK